MHSCWSRERTVSRTEAVAPGISLCKHPHDFDLPLVRSCETIPWRIFLTQEHSQSHLRLPSKASTCHLPEVWPVRSRNPGFLWGLSDLGDQFFLRLYWSVSCR